MENKFVKRGVALIMTVFTLVSCFAGTVSAQEWDVTRGETDYYVEMNESTNVFICNKGRISNKVGTEYYMTYTVERIEAESFSANGIMGTNQPGVRYPYLDSEDGTKGGLLYYSETNPMLIEGNTYFVKFTITEDGYKYRLGWAKDEEAEYIKLRSTAGKVKTDSEYFGIWLGNKKMNGKLTRVRIYDKNGNDLGVQVSPGKHVSVGREETFSKDTKIDHRYTVELKDAYNVALSNRRVATGDKIYMQYKVASSNSKVYQWGAILSDAPKDTYPYLKGQLQYTAVEFNPDVADNGPLLMEGAEYLIIFEKKGDYFDAIVQRTIGGKTTFVGLDTTYGTYDKEAKYFSLWFGGSKEILTNAVLEDFKCYDSNKNNLGLQCNKGGVEITHYGELEDYAGCEAMYYAEEDQSFYALYEDKSLKYTINGTTLKGSYKVRENILTTNVNGTDNAYDYKYLFFKEESGKEYRRLQSYKVSFDTKGGSPIETQILNSDNGYQVMRPNDPTMKNNTFKGWYTSSGEKFDFDQIITESVVVYAKWAESDYEVAAVSIDYMSYIYLGTSVVILALAIGACIFMTKRRKSHGTTGRQ